jgi:hypothetical protein
MAESSQNKIKRLMGQVVGVSAGATVVVATAAAVSISLQATFIDVTVFEDRAFYQLEVIETVTVSEEGETPEVIETEAETVRLRVQNQWDDISIPLVYGFNEGFIEPLRANQDYTLTIEVQRPVGWTSLDTYFFNTTPKTVATISSVNFNTTSINPLMNLELNVLTQQSANDDVTFYGSVLSPTIDVTFDLELGENLVSLPDLSHRNETLNIEIYASGSNGPTLLSSRDIKTPEFINASIDFAFPSLTTLQISAELDQSSFENINYGVRLYQEDTLLETFMFTNPSSLTIDNMLSNTDYMVEWYFSYQLGSGRKEVVIDQYLIRPILMPLFVLDIQAINQQQRLGLTIDKDLTYQSIQLVYRDTTRLETFSFTIETIGSITDLYQLTIPFLFTQNSELTLIITQPSPLDYPIVLRTIIFQGGN